MDKASTTDVPRWQRLAAVYAMGVVLALGSIALALTAGSSVDAAPELAEFAAVAGDATDCLGADVVAVQSGIYLDIHVPSEDGPGGQPGRRALRGEVDRDTGVADMTGTCVAGALSGQPATAVLTIDASGSANGVVRAGDRALDAELREASAATQTAKAAPLTGADLTARLFLAVAVVLVTTQIVGRAFSRIGLTRVMGEIVAGILLGPSLLGQLWPGALDYLFPGPVTGVLQMIGQFGLIFFMFLVGYELNLTMLRGVGHRVVLVSHVSIIVPFACGVGLAVLAYPLVGSGSFSGFALFFGAAMAITAFPVLARILTDTGLQHTALGALAISCAAVDDLTAWCILAGVVAAVNASGAGDVALTLVLTIVFIAVMAQVVRPLLRRAVVALRGRQQLAPVVMPVVLVAVLIAAWITEEVGIHPVFGAFLFGVVMPRSRRLKHEIEVRLADVTSLLLLPIFFAVVGLSTQITLLDRWELWGLTALIIALAIAGKLGGSLLAARVGGYSWRDATALGLLMNTRGLTEIVILTVGKSLGVISPALFAAMVLMALTTTFMAAPLLSLVYPRRRIEAEIALSRHEAAAHAGGVAHRVIVAVKRPEQAAPLVAVARALQPKDTTAGELVLAHVVPFTKPDGRPADDTANGAERSARVAMAPLASELLRSGIDTRVHSSTGLRVGRRLVVLAAEDAADLLLLGPIAEWPTGSRENDEVLSEVLAGASCNVAVLVGGRAEGAGASRNGSFAPPRSVAVWLRGTADDDAALEVAAAVSASGADRLRVVRSAGTRVPDDLPADAEVVLADENGNGAFDAAVRGADIVVTSGRDAREAIEHVRAAGTAEKAVLLVRRGRRA